MHAAVATAVNAATGLLVNAKDEPVDQDTNIVAGWTALWVFIALIVAVGLIGWALTRSLRTAERAKEAGVYGDAPTADDTAVDAAGPDAGPDGPDAPEGHASR
ncbi:hypothetical protein KVF89_29350 [Nocardioides carbamazepini]|uniref:hypothetical protein n=1 Tax=Nocardioides carbamazepini TaxID=2854259 RepID=UPI00214A2339|nr:hypothetical protein [Nocardioides carbamazepini]MCR1786678.1 hypothetical protein [Nocardioides carbamazepini]